MFNAPPYPLFLNLVQQPVLVVGGGSVGLRKATGLVECAARVTVVSPDFNPGFDNLTDIERIHAPYAQTHMARKMWRLVFATSDVPAINAQVQKHASATGILCCRADEPNEGDFTSGANIRVGATRKADGRGVQAAADIGGIIIAITTSGASPVLAARICREAAAGVDPILPLLADLLHGWRPVLKEHLSNMHLRRKLLQRLAGDEMENILRRHGAAAAQRTFDEWYNEARAQAASTPAGEPRPPKAP